MVSIEHLFHECNLHRKVLEIELKEPVLLCEKLVEVIIMLKLNCSDKEAEDLLKRYFNGIRTNNGIINIICSDEKGNPYNPQTMTLDLDNIKEISGRNQ